MPKVGEQIGNFFEDFKEGDLFKHWPGRTICQADNIWFTLLTLNTHPHFDANYYKNTEWKKPLVNSTLTVALVSGMSVTDISLNAVANLGWSNIKLTKPVFEGDTLYAESTILSLRESKSRPYAGIVELETIGRNQREEIVIKLNRTVMVRKKSNPDVIEDA